VSISGGSSRKKSWSRSGDNLPPGGKRRGNDTDRKDSSLNSGGQSAINSGCVASRDRGSRYSKIMSDMARFNFSQADSPALNTVSESVGKGTTRDSKLNPHPWNREKHKTSISSDAHFSKIPNTSSGFILFAPECVMPVTRTLSLLADEECSERDRKTVARYPAWLEASARNKPQHSP